MSKYNFEIDVSSRNSLYLIIEQIQKGSKVLEFGCANGRLTRYLKEELDCKVTIVEYDEVAGKQAAEFACESIIGREKGDIENFYWEKELVDKKYDYIIFADVLEHLHDPKSVLLRSKKFLSENGSFLVTVPNLANNSVIALLCDDKFRYQETGLLDETHIHFFSLESFRNMVNEIGGEMLRESATYSRIGNNEIPINFNEIHPLLRKYLISRELGDVYQFFFQFKNYEASNVQNKECLFIDSDIGYYFSEIFISENRTFTTLKQSRKKISLGNNILKFTFPLAMNINMIRFDPLNCSSIIKLKSFKINGQCIDFQEIETNADYICDDSYIFLTSDPNILINLNKIHSSLFIEIEFDVLDYDLQNDKFYECLIDYMKKAISQKDESIRSMSVHIRNLEAMFEQRKLEDECVDNLKRENEILIKELDEIKNSKIYKFYKKK